jgi:hypothetical protein
VLSFPDAPRFAPAMIFLACGFDGLAGDPSLANTALTPPWCGARHTTAIRHSRIHTFAIHHSPFAIRHSWSPRKLHLCGAECTRVRPSCGVGTAGWPPRAQPSARWWRCLPRAFPLVL